MTRYYRQQQMIDLLRADIANAVPPDKLIDQMQEEAAEFIAALSKIKRAMDMSGQNPTELSMDEAYQQAREEYTDLWLSVEIFNCSQFHPAEMIWVNESTRRTKIRRWHQRLVKSGTIKEAQTHESDQGE